MQGRLTQTVDRTTYFLSRAACKIELIQWNVLTCRIHADVAVCILPVYIGILYSKSSLAIAQNTYRLATEVLLQLFVLYRMV